jgi:Restriction endonuclease
MADELHPISALGKPPRTVSLAQEGPLANLCGKITSHICAQVAHDRGSQKLQRPGQDLQRLVRVIERATHHDGNVLVESSKRLRDKVTGRLREHDVVLTFTQRHHKILVALECRDRSRKVGVNSVEEFHSKCRDTGVHRGIIVSSIGFTRTALEKAAHYDIGCLSLDQAARLDWCLAPGIEVSHLRMIHVHLRAEVEREVGANAKLYANDGTLIGPTEMGGIGRHCLKGGIGRHCLKGRSPPTDGPVTRRFVDPAPAFYFVDGDGARIGLRRLLIEVTYEVTSRLSPFEFRAYVDRAQDKQLYTAAVANVDCGNVGGDIVMLHEEGRGAKVMFVPASRPPPSDITLSLGLEQPADRGSADPEQASDLGLGRTDPL